LINKRRWWCLIVMLKLQHFQFTLKKCSQNNILNALLLNKTWLMLPKELLAEEEFLSVLLLLPFWLELMIWLEWEVFPSQTLKYVDHTVVSLSAKMDLHKWLWRTFAWWDPFLNPLYSILRMQLHVKELLNCPLTKREFAILDALDLIQKSSMIMMKSSKSEDANLLDRLKRINFFLLQAVLHYMNQLRPTIC